MADREPSARDSTALKIRRSSVRIRDLFASGTAAKYSSVAAPQRSLGTLNAALACSTPVGDTPARGSGRRGRRFKSCHPDRVSAGQRPLPELARASLAASTATKYRQYRNKSEHLTFSSNGYPQPGLRFARTKRPQAKNASPRPEFPQVIPEVGVPWSPGNSRWTAHSGEAGSRLLAAVRAEMTSPNGGGDQGDGSGRRSAGRRPGSRLLLRSRGRRRGMRLRR